ncbi:MAG TPA: HisA/HisF-related TIM barrel protein [Candidatus Limnocylindria bacterium]|nr:HisA/HisF-related TIM barrel protein [Candidatus Limnocylindria bacterium]
MELIAAIDLLGGRSVRLRQGDFAQPMASGDPSVRAATWAAAGVPRLHLVDLEGARAGMPRAVAALAAVVMAARAAAPLVKVQIAGGLRTEATVGAVLDAGVDAAVLGTAALERPGFLAACAGRWPGRVLAALDLRDGRPAVSGWLRSRDDDALEVAGRLLAEGAAALIVTDTRRDGTLTGPNLALLASFRNAFPVARLVAAGGVRSTGDLLDLERTGLDGAIVGMALATGALRIPDALAALLPQAAPA